MAAFKRDGTQAPVTNCSSRINTKYVSFYRFVLTVRISRVRVRIRVSVRIRVR